MIEFKNVSFAYPDSTDGGLKNIDLMNLPAAPAQGYYIWTAAEYELISP